MRKTPEYGPLALAAAQKELLELAEEVSKARGCSKLEAIGLVIADLEARDRVANMVRRD